MEHVSFNSYQPLQHGNSDVSAYEAILEQDKAAEAAERERSRDLRRQQRNSALLTPYYGVINRLVGLCFPKDATAYKREPHYATLASLILDTMSEKMIKSPSLIVPHEEIVGGIQSETMQMCGCSREAATYLIERIIDLLSNREEGSQPFRVPTYNLISKNHGFEFIRYIVFEKVGSEAGWRLSEDGMRLTLRVLNTDSDNGSLNHDLLQRAFQRKNIDDIMHNLRLYRSQAHRQRMLIYACVRDLRMGTHLSFEHVGDPIIAGREIFEAQKKSTSSFRANILKLIEDEGFDFRQLGRLNEALETLKSISDAADSLHLAILENEVAVREALAAGIRVMSGETLLPDFMGEILAPMMELKGQHADAYVAAVEDVFALPRPIQKIFDMHGFLGSLASLQDLIADEVDLVEEEVVEEFVDLDSLNLQTRIKVKNIFISLVRPEILLSDYIDKVRDSEQIADHLKPYLYIQALAPPDGYSSFPVDAEKSRFTRKGVGTFTELLIKKNRG